jgi:hypothetical protein
VAFFPDNNFVLSAEACCVKLLQVDGQRVHHFERHRLRWVAAVAEYDIIGERLPVRVTRWTLRLMPTEDGPNGVVFI